VLFAATLAAYQPAWHGGMLWDDDAHMTRAELQSIEGLRRIWFEVGATQQYYPVAHTAFWVMRRVSGTDTFGYHLLNITLHSLSAWLAGMILRRLAVPGAWLAAVMFALHPVHVESVAWITELKNTLSGAFYLAAAWWYLRFDEDRRTRHYAPAIVLFGLALLSKTVTATLPAALLVVFWWKRGRLGWRRDVLPLVPFLLLGLGAGILTAWIERTFIGAVGEPYRLTAIERVLVAGRAIWFYFAKIVWPVDLSFNYPRWNISGEVWWQYLFPAGFVALAAGLWWWRHRSRGPLAAVLFFAGTLVPALGFFNVYPFRFSFVADHFQYLASLGIIALAAAGLITILRAWAPQAGFVELWASVALAIPLGALTFIQSRQYVDGETLYRATIDRNPSSWLAHNNLGALQLDGPPAARDEAVVHLEEALRLYPDYAKAHNNLGLAYQQMNRLQDALREHAEAARLEPGLAEAHYNLGLDAQGLGRLDEAVAHYRRALQLKPDYAQAHNNLGAALVRLGRFEEAADEFRRALRLTPASVAARENLARLDNALGVTRARNGDMEGAVTLFVEALRLKPDFPEAQANLAKARNR
jgi:Flp pilus assembly protein TadD